MYFGKREKSKDRGHKEQACREMFKEDFPLPPVIPELIRTPFSLSPVIVRRGGFSLGRRENYLPGPELPQKRTVISASDVHFALTLFHPPRFR